MQSPAKAPIAAPIKFPIKFPWHLQLLNAAAWLNLLCAATLIAAVTRFGPQWPASLSDLLRGGPHAG